MHTTYTPSSLSQGLRLCLALLLAGAPLAALAQPLFDALPEAQQLTTGPAASSSQSLAPRLPEGVSLASGISIPAQRLAGLESLTSLSLPLTGAGEWRYDRDRSSRFVNGDLHWRGSLLQGGQRHSLALTLAERRSLLATIHSPDGRFQIRAAFDAASNSYRGWLIPCPAIARCWPPTSRPTIRHGSGRRRWSSPPPISAFSRSCLPATPSSVTGSMSAS